MSPLAVEDLEAKIQGMLVGARQRFLKDAEHMTEALFWWVQPDGLATGVIAMPGLSDQEQRAAIRPIVRDCAAVGVVVVSEAWAVRADPRDRATVARHQSAKAAETIHLQPDREEILVFWAETAAAPVRQWHAKIARDPLGLGPWVELGIQLPRPGFKRYLTEPRR